MATSKTATPRSARKVGSVPAVFSFRRSLLVSDAPFFNEVHRPGEKPTLTPLMIVRQGIRATMNVVGRGNDFDMRNIQVTDIARSASDASAVRVRFGVRALDLSHSLDSCVSNSLELTRNARTEVENLVGRIRESAGLTEVSNRIARNIVNGTWLWRNRTIASGLQITVRDLAKVGGGGVLAFDALRPEFADFVAPPSADEKILADWLKAGFIGERHAGVEVDARIEFGVPGPVEVHPSQYMLERDKGPSRALYRILGSEPPKQSNAEVTIMGQAALRDAKVSNRLRAIDTWYPEFAELKRALPIEPNGATLDFNQAFRTGNDSAFSLFGHLGDIDPDTDQGKYVIGMLIRGGVLGQSEAKQAKEAVAPSDLAAIGGDAGRANGAPAGGAALEPA